MKKFTSKIAVLLILLVSIFGFVLTNQTNVSAEAPRKEKDGDYKYEGGNGSVTVTPKGAIILKYKYGFPEAVIRIDRCSEYRDDRGQAVKSDELEKATMCNGFNGGTLLIHVSGTINTKINSDGSVAEEGEKTIHFFKEGLTYDEIVQVRVQTAFFDSRKDTDATAPAVAYCNNDMNGIKGCDSSKTIAYYSIKSRYGSYIKSDSQIKFFDQKQLIYEYAGQSNSEGWVQINRSYGDGKIGFIRIDNSDFSTLAMDKMIYDDIIPLLIGVLVVAAGVSVMVLGYQIVKSADEDQERHDKIKRLRNILIGIGIALLLLFAIEPIANVVEGFLE